MTGPEVDGLNSGYAALLLEEYLDNPSAVPEEWRALFESAPEDALALRPGLARLLSLHQAETGNGHHVVEHGPPAPSISPPAANPAAGDRIGPVPASTRPGAEGRAPRPPQPGRGHGALSAARLPRPEAVLHRGARRARAHARRGDRGRLRLRRARGRDRHGAPRPSQ